MYFRKHFRMISTLLLAVALVFSACVPSSLAEGAAKVHKLEKKTVPIYFQDRGKVLDAVPLVFIDGVQDLPYMDLGAMKDFLNTFWSTIQGNEETVIRYKGEYDPAIQRYTLTYEPTGVVMLFNLAEETIIVSDYDMLNRGEGENLMDLLNATGFNAIGEPETFQRVEKAHLLRNGKTKVVPLGEYDIHFILQDGMILLPMQTLMCFLVAIPFGGMLCYNGEGIFLGGSTMLCKDAYDAETGMIKTVYTEMGDLYYSVAPKMRSKELAEFGAHEFCLEMDCFYGLKDIHGIDSFYDLLINTGLLQRFLDPDPAVADKALQELINFYLDDLHSAYLANSWATGRDKEMISASGYSSAAYAELSNMYKQFMNAFMPDGRPAYQEIGDTAYVTFDEFEANGLDYYAMDMDDDASIQDTISLMMFAHRKITRENSPIRNVVLDLTMNDGGDADAAVFVISWFLGEGQISQMNTFTEARATNVYRADANLDRVFDSDDCLYHTYNLYCLCSPLSFSCGNLVPWAFHASGQVTLIGDTTGGGSCIVLPMATAWGTIFQTSSPNRLSFIRNGSYYDIDMGVNPDTHLSRTANYFNREALTEIIHNLPFPGSRFA